MAASTGRMVDLMTETWRKQVQFEKDLICVRGKRTSSSLDPLLKQIGEYIKREKLQITQFSPY